MKTLPSTSNSTKPHTRPYKILEPETQEEQEEEEEEERVRCEWDITLSMVVSSGISNTSTTSSTYVSSDALGVVEFDPTGCFLATGGIARKIRLYKLDSLLPFTSTVSSNSNTNSSVAYIDHASAGGNYYICTPAKLSSLKWKPGSGGRVIGSGDYDGVVMEYDLETKVPVYERDEHGGRRVWSVDYSCCGDPVLGASGSDDGSMQVWDPRCEGGESVGAVWPSRTPSSSLATSSVCCVEFNPLGGWMVAVGCTDRRAYVYDIRMLVNPVHVLDGHNKTVTYVKFLDNETLVSSSIDGCLRLWDLERGACVVRTYRGHMNSRNFVGLSVWRDGGLLGCGSEDNQVFVYDKRWGEPIWVHGFELMGGGSRGHGFVNSVCWRQAEGQEVDHCILVAGGSDGVLQVFQGRRKYD